MFNKISHHEMQMQSETPLPAARTTGIRIMIMSGQEGLLGNETDVEEAETPVPQCEREVVRTPQENNPVIPKTTTA